MAKLNWDSVQELAQRKATLLTKTKVPFQILATSDNSVIIRVSSGRKHTISRIHLETAVAKIQEGFILSGPLDYRNKIADDRPAYAWAILRELGYIK